MNKKAKDAIEKIVVNEDLLKEIHSLSTLQATIWEIAQVLRVDATEFSRLAQTDETVAATIRRGNTIGRLRLRQKQFERAGTNCRMAIHLGIHYLGQKRRPPPQVQETAQRVEADAPFDTSRYTKEELATLTMLLARQEEEE